MKNYFKSSVGAALGVLFFAQFLSAAEENILSEKIFSLPDQRGTLQVVIKQSDSRFGLPYSVEGQAQCKSQGARSVLQAHSVCDVKPQSVKLDATGTKVLVKVRETDSDDFNKRTRNADPESLKTIEPKCKVEAREVEIKLDSFCI